MPIWNTKEIAKKVQEKIGTEYSVSIYPRGGGVDTFHIQILSKKWGGDIGDNLFLCGFKTDGYFESADDIECEIQMVELQNCDGKENLHKDEDLSSTYSKIAFLLTSMGFEVVDDLEQYF